MKPKTYKVPKDKKRPLQIHFFDKECESCKKIMLDDALYQNLLADIDRQLKEDGVQ